MIAVAGGTGTLGSAVVGQLLERGERVRILSRRPPVALEPGCEHLSVDLSAAEADQPGGLVSALDGVRTVIDAANNSRGSVMLQAGERLISACVTAGVHRFIGISIVGCEQAGLGYYKAKARQEEMLRESPVNWSLLRATQFHELIDGALASGARFGVLPGGPARLQPIAAGAAAESLAAIATDERPGQVTQISGPEIRTLGELARQWKRSTGSRAVVAPLPLIGKTGRAIAAGAFTLPSAAGSGPDFENWLNERYGRSGE